MSSPIERQLEEARQALPTPPGSSNQMASYLFRSVFLYIGLIAFLVLMFHVFNRQQGEPEPGERAPAPRGYGAQPGGPGSPPPPARGPGP